MLYFNYFTNPCQPDKGRISCIFEQPKTVWQIIREQKVDLTMPILCLINGAPVMRKNWGDVLDNGELVSIIALPLGGGGGKSSNPVQVVLTVAVIVASVYTGGAVGAAYGTAWGATAAAAVSIGGSILVNTLVPTPKPALNGMTSSSYTQSPTYSLQAQGNTARLGNPIPVIYGKHLIYPDFAAQPYYRYKNNEQYVYQLHCIGQGYYSVGQIRIEDTPISSFKEITYKVINPGETNTLFDEDVVTSPEVAGQELLKGEICGGFVLNPTESVINKIEIDVAFQRGLYYANDSGNLNSKTIQWRVDARLIDDEDNALGDWKTLGTESVTDSTVNGIYKTYTYNVTKGRYEVRATRLDDKDESSRAGHEIRWVYAKGYVVSDKSYGNVTLLAVIMKATDNLSQRSSRLVNCVVTRKLKTWTPSGGWSGLTATRSIAWALADILKADYGAKLTDKSIDLNALYQLNQKWNSRGDTFNAVFDSKLTVYEALSRVAKVGRAVAFIQGGIVRFVRDEPKTIPVAMFSPRNIVKNSLSIQYIMPSEDTADSVCVEYFSENTWKTSEITGTFADSSSDKTATVELFGCTNKAQAQREAVYMALANRYRRRIVTFTTELEGLIPTYGDLIAITHDMAHWGSGGEIIAQDRLKLTLSEPVEFTSGVKNVLALRNKNGSLSGVYEVTATELNTEVMLKSQPDAEILTTSGVERTHYAFGTQDKWSVYARVTGIRPRSNQVEITAVIEDDRVHQN
ncbi:MAG: phage tail protein [Alphaproteobacteria bacterium]|nr:phage tail protein [Alphaproteobacteria bacterium]MBR1757091.1 phage tail protein [Alphaproteobacteria bacterium]